MSENTTSTTATVMPTIDPLAMLIERINEANDLGRKIQAARSDRTAAISSVIETSNDPKVVKFREIRAKVLEQIETYKAQIVNAEALIKEHAETLIPGVDADFDVDKATEKFTALRKAAHTTRVALEAFVPAETLDEVLQSRGVAEIVSLRGTGVNKGGAKGATGVKRPRISAATYNGEAVTKKDGTIDFTALGKASDVTADDLKVAAFAAAGTEDLNSLDAGTVVAFEIGDKKFTVTVSDKKPGRPAGSKKDEDKKPE